MTVVDSSVIVDVLIDRLDVAELGAGPLIAPNLVENEVISVLRGHWLAGKLADDDADRLFEAFDELLIDRHPAEPLRRRVWELRHNLSAYAAAYVALAEQLGVALLTRDARIAHAPGIHCTVEVL